MSSFIINPINNIPTPPTGHDRGKQRLQPIRGRADAARARQHAAHALQLRIQHALAHEGYAPLCAIATGRPIAAGEYAHGTGGH